MKKALEAFNEVLEIICCQKQDNNLQDYINIVETTLKTLKTLEEEFGIDLITLFKCFKSTKFYVKNLFNEIIEVKSDAVRFDLGNGYVYFGIDYCPLSSYGKTWAMNKEDLKTL